MEKDKLQKEDLALQLPVLRIKEIEIKDFRNIRYGNLDILIHGQNSQASITGLYGQNGSGKTSVITALSILKELLTGRRLSSDIYRQVNVESDKAQFSFTFEFLDKYLERQGKAVYSFNIGRREDEEDTKTVVFDEVLKLSSRIRDFKFRLQDLFNTSGVNPLEPAAKVEKLLGDEYLNSTEIIIEKELAKRESRSFLFSSWLLNKLCDGDESESKEVLFMKYIFFRLRRFAERELYIVTTEHNGILSLGIMPLMINQKSERRYISGVTPIGLNQPTPLPSRIFDAEEDVLQNLNQVLGEIVPGLSLSMKVLETRLDEDGEEVKVVQLLSHKNEKEIPLEYESEGIKKIISVLHLLICVYNQSSITVAIDEFDAGIFEFLLGELLQVIQTNGKGQLIFTSHNLRPLEVLDKSSIVFSTTNPYDRFIRMKNVKNDNNLRSMYYRDLIVNEQEEELYHASNQSMISLAFRNAGLSEK